MMQKPCNLKDEVNRIRVNMDEQHNGQEQDIPETSEREPEETIHIHYFPDAIVVLKEEKEPDNPICFESNPVTSDPGKPSLLPAYLGVFLYLFLILSTLAMQLFVVFNPPSATVFILTPRIPVSTQTTLTLPV